MQARKYKRCEKGLETKERKYIESAKMQTLLNKLSNHFGFEFTKPDFRPVYINKRLKKYWGLFRGDKIDIIDGLTKSSRNDTLWHEMLHAVVADNYNKYCDINKYKDMPWDEATKIHKMRGKIEKAIFTLEGRGSHHTQNYKLSCTCGYWLKTVKRRTSAFCRNCNVSLVSPKEYRKLKKMAEINSRIKEINIDNYRPWKENKKIGVKIK